VVYFLLYLFCEVMVTSTIAGEIGGLATFIEIIISAIIGIFLLQNLKFSILEKVSTLRSGNITQEEFIKGSIGAAAGAILLIIPGFFTDILGILLQFSFFAVISSKFFKFKTKPKNSFSNQSHFSYTSYSNNTQHKTKGDDDVIDVEIIDDNKSINR
jgi:UPF0716 protein FxsA